MDHSQANTTLILTRVRKGDADASSTLLSLVYDELHRLAGSYMRRQRSDHTLQPTALVNEAFLQLIGQMDSDCTDRAHFMAVAATAMRQILIKHARKKKASKRGGEWRRLTLNEAILPSGKREFDLIVLDDLLTKLAQLSERQCRVVELRFFAGLTIAETAEVLGIGTTTVEDDWHMARAWLALQLDESEGQ